jgi:hypothetical protein
LGNDPERDKSTLLSELQAGLSQEQRLLDELTQTLALLRRAARVEPGQLNRDEMWLEVKRRLATRRPEGSE